jgi:hypothetical protein
MVVFFATAGAGDMVPADTLEPLEVFGGKIGEAALNRPAALQILPQGTILIADRLNNRLVEFSPQGTLLNIIGSIGSCRGDFSGPSDIAVVDTIIFVADRNNKRICLLSHTFEWLGEIQTGTAVDQLIPGPDQTVYASCRMDKPGMYLFDQYSRNGQKLGQFGSIIGPSESPWSVRTLLNRVVAARIDEETMVICNQSVPVCAIGNGLENLSTSWLIEHDLIETLQWFYSSHTDIVDTSLVADKIRTEEDYLSNAYLIASKSHEAAELISQVIGYGDNILVILSSMIHEYDRTGKLLRRTYLRDRLGYRAYASRIDIGSDGVLYALDGIYTFICRAYQYDDQISAVSGSQ